MEQAKAFASDVVRDAHFVYGQEQHAGVYAEQYCGPGYVQYVHIPYLHHNMVAM